MRHPSPPENIASPPTRRSGHLHLSLLSGVQGVGIVALDVGRGDSTSMGSMLREHHIETVMSDLSKPYQALPGLLARAPPLPTGQKMPSDVSDS